MILTACLEDAKSRKRTIRLSYIDFEKAFDSVEHWALFDTLEHYSVPGNIVEMIRELYKENAADLNTPLGKSSRRVQITRGIRQGDGLSPLLFIIFINTLLEKFETEGIGYEIEGGNPKIPHLSFADDINIVTSSFEEEQRAWKIVEEFCRATGMRVNINKTLRTQMNDEDNREIIFEGSPIKSIGEDVTVRFLGAKRSLDLNLKEEENKAKFLLGNWLDKIRDRCFSTGQKIRIYNKLIVPKVSFPFSFCKFTETTLAELDNMTARFFKKEIGLLYQLKNDRLFDRRTWGIVSIRETQNITISASVINQGLQSKSVETRPAIESRLR